MNQPVPSTRPAASCQLRIPFHDLDPTGVVWHGRYLKYFETARVVLMDDLGYGYEEMKQSGFNWPIVDARVRYIRPLSLHQDVCVMAELREWEMRIVINYRIEDEHGRVCTRARTVQVAVDAKTGIMCLNLPQVLIDRIDQWLST